ncbi:hypothetical protein LJR219_003527 [Phenylobacterium sp. LjRoot219]|uniref:hypothetical protein n=1 Tax=Phenylobacterium sp. LjRoot219 TaxID=3342283 RepID=UPI003ECE5207
MADQDRSFAPDMSSTRPQSAEPDERIDDPQEDLGEAVEEGMLLSATRRGDHDEPDHTQGAKTRRMTKDIISRRG